MKTENTGDTPINIVIYISLAINTVEMGSVIQGSAKAFNAQKFFHHCSGVYQDILLREIGHQPIYQDHSKGGIVG